jgi:hypothetical protein
MSFRDPVLSQSDDQLAFRLRTDCNIRDFTAPAPFRFPSLRRGCVCSVTQYKFAATDSA